ncbi:MAG: hypothetical protein IPJ65_01680 [Archangiaceae bacterium]|nr:hypothetical protein [Archangiaceae bacterium]
MTAMLVAWLLSAEPVVSTVPCQTVAECWLDADGKAVARPRAKKGRALPRGDCGKNILWLRNRLSCEQRFCVVQFIGDKC